MHTTKSLSFCKSKFSFICQCLFVSAIYSPYQSARWFELDHSVSALAGSSPHSPGRAPPMAAILFIVPSLYPA